jgi:hypothetical protein
VLSHEGILALQGEEDVNGATLSEQVIQNRLVIYPVIAIAVPFIFIGGKQDNPTSPVSPHSGRGI